MNVPKIQAALRRQKQGLITITVVDKRHGCRFMGCALGALFHAAGKSRQDIIKGRRNSYSEMFDELLNREYGLEPEEVTEIYYANDDFQYECKNHDPVRLRDFMILWVEKFAKYRKNNKVHKADQLARKAVGCDF